MELAVAGERGVAPCAINRDSNQLRAKVMKVFEDFVVESHLIAADRTPISWVKRERDRLTAEFAQRKPLIRCASQGEIGRFHSWRQRCASALGIHFFVTMSLPRLPVGRGVCFRGRWHERRTSFTRSGDARFYLIVTGSRRARLAILNVTRALERVVIALAQATFTSICLGWACSLFGTCTVRTPSLNSAFTLKSASSGRAKLRMKVP